MELKSKIIQKNKIDWDNKIVISELYADPKIVEAHKERVNNVFKNLSEDERNQQIHNIIVRDNIFNKAMDYLSTCYKFDFDKDDIEMIKQNIGPTLPEQYKDKIDTIATKIITKDLIFKDLQKEYDIHVNDQELLNMLNNYYKQTNMPIRDFTEDRTKFENAKASLLEEKTTAFIIDRFPKDLSELQRKIYESLQQKQDDIAKDKQTNNENNN